MFDWLDKKIEEQKTNTEITNKICNPYSPAELQEKREYGEIE